MKLYVKYSKDWPYLPEYVEDSAQELAKKTGHTTGSILSCISKGYPMWARVEVEDGEQT